MLTTFRGRQYDTGKRADVRALAAATGMTGHIDRMLDQHPDQDEIDRAVWTELLWQGPGSLTAFEQAGGAR